jgi:UDP-N-acetylmuramoyl-L-alanyl-D-glutamate--2,6-diaminopimelate ligase
LIPAGRRLPFRRDACPVRLVTIGEILGAPVPAGTGETEVSELAYDSHAVVPGTMFFCRPGSREDGHDWAPAAVRSGAVALVCERQLPLEVPQLVVASSRRAMNRLAHPFFGEPTRQLGVAGITGTNGKTTTSFRLESIFKAAGDPAGLVGTIEVRIAGERIQAGRTTPESIDLARFFRRMVDAGVGRCAVEVTSIGLDQGRTDGIDFDVAVFTNLTHDHLDHHGSMERYYQAKKRLFTDWRALPVVNADDGYGRRLASELKGKALTFGVGSPADLTARDLVMDRRGSRFRAAGPGIDLLVRVGLPGAFNVSNGLAALAAAHLMGVDGGAVAAGLESLTHVPGRFEPVDEGQPFLAVVDYAHTPDGLARVLSAARELAEGRVIAVFGCGGDRDRAKRAVMGRIASRQADVVVATSDNPRSEKPEDILAEIETGLAPSPPPGGYRIVPDRAEAIGIAVGLARKGDVLVVAGKGHETGQEFAERTLPFDDRLVTAEALRRL